MDEAMGTVQGLGYRLVVGRCASQLAMFADVSVDTNPSCSVCFAVVPRTLMHFHRLWHENQEGRSTPPFEDHGHDQELRHLVEAVLALRAIVPVSSRSEFVEKLREQLMAETLERALRAESETEPPRLRWACGNRTGGRFVPSVQCRQRP